MDEFYKPTADKQSLDNSWNRYDIATRQNQETNNESRQTLTEFYDKIALYSAGAISFSTTIIGLVLANYPQSLSTATLYFPNVYFLYVSWLAFAIAFVFALLSKRVEAYYVSAFGFTNYTKKYYEYLESQVAFYKAYKDNVIFQGGAYQDHLATDNDNIIKVKKAHKFNKNKSKRYYSLLLIARRGAEIGAAIGLIFLLAFAVMLTQSVIGNI